jgi:hypothetical protein
MKTSTPGGLKEQVWLCPKNFHKTVMGWILPVDHTFLTHDIE